MGQSQNQSYGQSLSFSQTLIGDLPNELLFGIFQQLSPQDMKAVVLVCKSWRVMGEDPTFWTWAVVTVSNKDDLNKLKIPRLAMMQEVIITHLSHGGVMWCRNWVQWGWRKKMSPVECHWIKEGGLPDLLQVISEIPTVRRIHGLEYCKGVSNIEPELVSRVLSRLEELNLCFGGDMILTSDKKKNIFTQLILSAEQLELLFSAVARKTSLRLLKVSHQPHIKEISPELFAAAVSNVEEVVLEAGPRLKYIAEYERPITTKQLTAILRNVVEGESRIKRLMFKQVDPETVQNLDLDLVRRVKDKIGEFYTSYYY